MNISRIQENLCELGNSDSSTLWMLSIGVTLALSVCFSFYLLAFMDS